MDQRESTKALLREYLSGLPQKNKYVLSPAMAAKLRQTIETFLLIEEKDIAPPPENDHYHVGRPCARKFHKGETCYRCLTCGYDETCALCSYCFQPERHRGHQVHRSIIQRDNAGCCDCGDPEAYVHPLCNYYYGKGVEQSEEGMDSSSSTNSRSQSSSISSSSSSQSSPPHITSQFVDNFEDVVSVLLDYLIDVSWQDLSSLVTPKTRQDVARLSEATRLDTAWYGVEDSNSTQYALIVYNDLLHQYRDAVQRVRFTTGKKVEFAEMIVTQCQTRGRAIVMISDDVNLLLQRQQVLTTTGLTGSIRSTRDVFREVMCDQIASLLFDLSQSALVSNSSALRDTFARVVLSPHHDGCLHPPVPVYKDGVFLSPPCLSYTPFRADFPGASLSWGIPDEVLNECHYRDLAQAADSARRINGALADANLPFAASRFQYLLFCDIRLSRSCRQKLHDAAVQVLINNLRYKMLSTAQFLDIYSNLLTLFLSFDREPECSIMPILTTQLFTCPSSCAAILRHGDVLRMIRSVDHYLRLGTTKGNPVLCAQQRTTDGLLCRSLKNRRWGHIFMDLNYIITRNPENEGIIHFLYAFPAVVHMFSLIQSRPQLVRQANRHVEYEFTDYGVFFNAVSLIVHFGESIGKVINRLPENVSVRQSNSPKYLTDLIYLPLIEKLVEIAFGLNPTNESTLAVDETFLVTAPSSTSGEQSSDPLPITSPTTPPSIITEREEPVVFATFNTSDGQQLRLVKFEVLTGRVSFLHPLHALLGWIIETDRSISSPERLARVVQLMDSITLAKVPNAQPGDGHKAILDIALRTMVLLSQIKVGLWVRNGLSVRTQMNIYKFSGIRECGFMKDLMLCQLLCASCPPEEAFWTLISRWDLESWCTDQPQDGPYGAQHTPEMVTEFLLFLINLLTEDFHLHKRDSIDVLDLVIAREIIHTLCFKPLNYSQLTSEIPEHLCSEKRFFIVFDRCTEEVGNKSDIDDDPSTLDHLKMYRLKENYYSLVDPFYIYYSANRREECIQLVKKRLRASKHGKTNAKAIPLSAIVIPPKHVDWSDSPFARLAFLPCCPAFLNFIHHTLDRCLHLQSNKCSATYNVDTLLSLTLHLLHIALDQQDLTHFGSEFFINSGIPQILFDMLMDDAYANFAPKVRAILDIFCHQSGLTVEEVQRAIPNYSRDIVLPDSGFDKAAQLKLKKKRMAKSKRDQILAKMKEQQRRFAEKHSSEIKMEEESDSSVNTANETPFEQDNNVSLFEDMKYAWKYPEERCIFCQMPARTPDEPFGIFSFASLSNEFRSVPYDDKDKYWFYKAFSGSQNLDERPGKKTSKLSSYLTHLEQSSNVGPGFPNGDTCWNENRTVITSCCHGMHFSCFLDYVQSLKSKQASQLTRTMPEESQKLEFLCPLCKAVNNMFIPVIYSWNNDRFDLEFKTPITSQQISDFMNPGFISNIEDINESSVSDMIREELVSSFKAKIKAGHWFIKNDALDSSSLTLKAISHAMDSFGVLSTPLESVSDVITSTIASVEISLRGLGYSEKDTQLVHSNDGTHIPLILSQLSSQIITTLRVWCQLRDLQRCEEIFTKHKDVGQSHAVLSYPQRLLGLIINVIENEQLIYEGEDFFKLLVGVLPLQCLNMSFQKLLFICYVRHVKQSLLKVMIVLKHRCTGLNTELLSDSVNTPLSEDLSTCLCNAFAKVMDSTAIVIKPLVASVVYDMTIKLILPFLRRSLIYAYIMFGNFKRANQTWKSDGNNDECHKICSFLKLPSIKQIILSMDLNKIDSITQENWDHLHNSGISYPGVISLLQLPEQLNTFFTKLCVPNTNKEKFIREPAICLYCGTILDIQKADYGDRYGSCYTHLQWDCLDSDGRGLFFIPRNNCVLLLEEKKGTFIKGPYHDIHGECTTDSKKAHDLFLSHKRFDQIVRNIWLEHDIQNHIARQMDSRIDIGGWLTL